MTTNRPIITSQDVELASASRNARWGRWLFFVYLILYAVYMALCAFKPALMDRLIDGVNLAIWYGMGLIVTALLLALIYMWACNPKRSRGGAA